MEENLSRGDTEVFDSASLPTPPMTPVLPRKEFASEQDSPPFAIFDAKSTIGKQQDHSPKKTSSSYF
jgi:hypothetical protein